MEQYLNEQKSEHLYIDETGKENLLQSVKWSKFIAIFLFVILGLMILGGLMLGATGSVLEQYSYASGNASFAGMSKVLMVTYILMAILYFFPTLYLYKFSSLIKSSMYLNNQQQFNEALVYQRKMYKFVGIMVMIMIILYALLFIFAIVVGVVSNI